MPEAHRQLEGRGKEKTENETNKQSTDGVKKTQCVESKTKEDCRKEGVQEG